MESKTNNKSNSTYWHFPSANVLSITMDSIEIQTIVSFRLLMALMSVLADHPCLFLVSSQRINQLHLSTISISLWLSSKMPQFRAGLKHFPCNKFRMAIINSACVDVYRSKNELFGSLHAKCQTWMLFIPAAIWQMPRCTPISIVNMRPSHIATFHWTLMNF